MQHHVQMDNSHVTRAELDGVLDRITSELSALKAENAALRAGLTHMAPAAPTVAASTTPLSRRVLIRRAGQVAAVAAGGVAAATAFGSTPAAAAPGTAMAGATAAGATAAGTPVLLGQGNDTGDLTTGIVRTSGTAGVVNPVLKVSSNTSGAAIEASSELGLIASGFVGVDASGTDTGLMASGPIAVNATGSKYGVIASGTQAPLALAPNTAPTGPHAFGEITLDTSGNLRVCVNQGTPGEWRRLRTSVAGYDQADASAIGSSGLLHLMARPYRLFDSRPGAPAPLGHTGKIMPGTPQEIQVIGTVPLGGGPFARGVGALLTITITQTEVGGHLTAYPTGASPVPDTSIINWYATGQTVATTTVVRYSASGNITIAAFGHPTHLVVDVIGFIG
jgi:hypothetical protein